MEAIGKRNLIRMLIDLIIAAIIGGSLLVIKFAAVPFHRGFFCDDESIKHPFKHSTISTLSMALFSIIIVIAGMLVVEGLQYWQAPDKMNAVPVGPCRVHGYLYICYYTIGLFLCGMGVTQQFTDLTKNAVGRLRPHFLTLCNPNFAQLNCSGYVEGDVCDPTADKELLIDARRSFMSGHSSVSMYAAVYFVIYLQVRLKINRYTYLIKPVTQAWSVLLALYVGLSRISDYKHHWSDVLTGCFTGAVIAIITACCISNLFKLPCQRTISAVEMQKKTDEPSVSYGSTEVTVANCT